MTDSQDLPALSKAITPPQPLDLSLLATVEVTSQDDLFPIEQAFRPEPALGWRASTPGVQSIRILFHEARPLEAVRLHFVERAAERSQQIFLRLRTRSDSDLREVARREFTFSPSGLTDEIEEIALSVDDLTALDLTIDPDHGHTGARHGIYATLTSMQLIPMSAGTKQA